jgi:hypothetical protein
MSVSPAQKRSNPPPVPEIPTVTWTPEFCASNCSAPAVTRGPTVLEPSTSIRPERLELAFEMAAFVPSDAESLRPQAAVAVATNPAARTSRRILP